MSRPERSPQPEPAGGGRHVSEFVPRAYMSAYRGLYGYPERQRKRLPPFGRDLSEALLRGQKPRNDVRIYLGHGAWDQARYANDQSLWVALALPDDQPPEAFRWPVSGCSVLVVPLANIDGDIIQRLALVLLEAGATAVRGIHQNGALTVFGGEQ